jgi:transposase
MIRFMKVDGRKLNHAHLEEIRVEAVKAVQSGKSPSEVAREMGIYPNRVFVWLAAYRAGGWDALRARKATGRPKRLTGRQLKWIFDTVTTKNPMQLKFAFALWTRAMMRTLINREFDIKYKCGLCGTTTCSNRANLPKAADPGI